MLFATSPRAETARSAWNPASPMWKSPDLLSSPMRCSCAAVILWSLSASAHDWLPRETLTRLCTSPVIDVLEWEWDLGSSAMEARILRPLLWFGLLESRTEPRSATEVVDRRLYRKASLLDRLVKFDVQVEGSNIRH